MLNAAQLPVPTKRIIQRQYNRILTSPLHFLSPVVVVNDYQWEATILGPPGSPYEGGKFCFVIHFPPEFPMKPPKIIPRNLIYHPNFENRKIYNPILMGDNWSPAYFMAEVFQIIYDMLLKPNIEEGFKYVKEIADEYKNDKAKFDSIALDWTKRFAT